MKTQQKRLAGSLALALSGALTGVALSQPDPNNAPKATNPTNPARANRANRPNLREMTPEQRQQALVQVRERTLRRLLERAGYNDRQLVDSIVAFVNTEETARRPVAEQTRKVAEALSNEATSDTQFTTLMADLRTATETEKTRREAATKAFAEKIQLAQKPRLEAMLTVLGIVGEQASLASGIGSGLGGGLLGQRTGAGGLGGMMGQRGGRGGAVGQAPGAAGQGAAAPAVRGNRANRANRPDRANRTNRGNQAAPAGGAQ